MVKNLSVNVNLAIPLVMNVLINTLHHVNHVETEPIYIKENVLMLAQQNSSLHMKKLEPVLLVMKVVLPVLENTQITV